MIFYFFRLLISSTFSPWKFLSQQKKNKTKQETSSFIGSWLCCKGKVSVPGWRCWIPGQHSVCFCLKVSPEISLTSSLHKHSRPILNSTQPGSDQWNQQLGFLTKFGHAVKWVLTAFSLVKRGGVKQKERISELPEKCGACMYACGLGSSPYVKVKLSNWSGISKQAPRFSVKLFTLPGNVYIPEHDLFSDIPVGERHRGCVVHIIQGVNGILPQILPTNCQQQHRQVIFILRKCQQSISGNGTFTQTSLILRIFIQREDYGWRKEKWEILDGTGGEMKNM